MMRTLLATCLALGLCSCAPEMCAPVAPPAPVSAPANPGVDTIDPTDFTFILLLALFAGDFCERRR